MDLAISTMIFLATFLTDQEFLDSRQVTYSKLTKIRVYRKKSCNIRTNEELAYTFYCEVDYF